MALRWTKDLLAIIITSIFLLWVVGTAFVPLWYYPARDTFYGIKGANLVILDLFAGLCCLSAYIAMGHGLPNRLRAKTR